MTDDRHLGHITPGFPILDADRQGDNTICVRTIFDVFGCVEPRVPETDYWVSMPVRLAHSQAAGYYLEVGPYDLDAADIHRLRQAIAAYDKAVGK
jgi:hypothetical protein